jgi:hypothetical protein
MDKSRPVSEILPGSDVVDADGKSVGRVLDATPSYVVVERGHLFPDDVFIPISAIADYDPATVRLNLTAQQALAESWEKAPPSGAGFLSTATQAPGIIFDGDVEGLGTTEDDET